jgi:periplasmic protein TonB
MATCIDHLLELEAVLPVSLRINAYSSAKQKQVAISASVRPIEDDGLLFEDTLVVSGRKSRSRNVWATAGSLILQLVLLAAVIIIPLYHTELLPKRETLTMLYAPPSPPPPPAAANATRLRTPTRTSTYRPTSIGLPSPKPMTQEAPPTSTVGGVIGGVPGGVIGGVPGGVLGNVLDRAASAPVLAKTPKATPVKRVRLAQRVVEANLIHDVAPTYPSVAGRDRVEGTVVLWAVIGKDGTVQDVRVESGLPVLAQAAIDAVKQWRYKPYLLNGEPVEVDSHITINFTLFRG